MSFTPLAAKDRRARVICRVIVAKRRVLLPRLINMQSQSREGLLPNFVKATVMPRRRGVAASMLKVVFCCDYLSVRIVRFSPGLFFLS